MKFKIKTTVFPNGERFPLMLNENRIPDYWSTIFVITQLRGTNKASGTIEKALQNIIVLKYILEKYNINENILIERFEEGRILNFFEIEGITEECKFYLKDILSDKTPNKLAKFSIKSLEKVRMIENNQQLKRINSNTIVTRIRTIMRFLKWFSNVHISRLGVNHPNYKNLIESKEQMLTLFHSLIPKILNSSIIAKEGLTKKEMNKLFSMINRNSKTNPWRSEFVKVRNELIVIWLYKFGMRRSELLNIKVSDIDFKKESFSILRRPDDPSDPRRNKPNVKTRGREISIPLKIIEMTYEYITKYRVKLSKSKTHEYLFIADKTGNALSSVSINKIFEKLRNSNSDLPKNLSAHLLRHSWNDNFSEIMDEKGIEEGREQQMRNYLMGWSINSRSSENYTRRHVRNKANEVILQLGNKFFNNKGINNDK